MLNLVKENVVNKYPKWMQWNKARELLQLMTTTVSHDNYCIPWQLLYPLTTDNYCIPWQLRCNETKQENYCNWWQLLFPMTTTVSHDNYCIPWQLLYPMTSTGSKEFAQQRLKRTEWTKIETDRVNKDWNRQSEQSKLVELQHSSKPHFDSSHTYSPTRQFGYTVKPLYNGHLRTCKEVSCIEVSLFRGYVTGMAI
jgi:hypothetical protein